MLFRWSSFLFWMNVLLNKWATLYHYNTIIDILHPQQFSQSIWPSFPWCQCLFWYISQIWWAIDLLKLLHVALTWTFPGFNRIIPQLTAALMRLISAGHFWRGSSIKHVSHHLQWRVVKAINITWCKLLQYFPADLSKG